MTTSGTVTFNLNRDQIIRAALRKIGAIASGETPDAETVQDCAQALNAMVKRWDATGIHIWTESEATLFLQPSQYRYVLGPGSTDNATEDWGQTTLAASAASGDTSLTVDSIEDIDDDDYCGVVLDDGTIFWSQVNGAPSGTTVVIDDALTGAATSGNAVYFYTTKINTPLRVVDGRRYLISSAIDTSMIPLSRLDYRDLPNKANTGTITQFFYDPRGGTNTTGLIWLWPSPSDATAAFKFTWYRRIQDFTAAANTPDLPPEWLDTLIFNLAVVMSPEYDVPAQRFAILKGLAAEYLDLVSGWDREPESIYFGVDFSQR